MVVVIKSAACQLAEEIDKWSFMPGWTVDVYDILPRSVVVRFRGSVLDSHGSGKTVVIECIKEIPDRFPLESLGAWLRSIAHAMVCHEADEWLRRDGEMVFDPHR